MDLQPQLRDSDSDDGLHREPIIGSEAGWDAASDDTSDDNTEMGYFETFSSEDAGEREDDYDGGRGYKPVGSVRAAELHGRRAADYRYGTKIRHRRYYTVGELLMDKWLYVVDNEFTLGLSEMMDKWREHRSQTPPAKLCNDCHSRRVLFRCLEKEDRKQDLKIAKLRRSAASCELCGFFLRSVEKHVTEDKKVQIYRYCSMLKVVTDRWEDKESVPFLTILADPGLFIASFLPPCNSFYLRIIQIGNVMSRISKLAFQSCQALELIVTSRSYANGFGFATVDTKAWAAVRPSLACFLQESLTLAPEVTLLASNCTAQSKMKRDPRWLYPTVGESLHPRNAKDFVPSVEISSLVARVSTFETYRKLSGKPYRLYGRLANNTSGSTRSVSSKTTLWTGKRRQRQWKQYIAWHTAPLLLRPPKILPMVYSDRDSQESF